MAEFNRRTAATVPALVVAMIATLGVVAFLIAVVVRPDGREQQRVDWIAAAEAAAPGAPGAIAAPRLPDGWWANSAEMRTIDGVRTWDVGLLSPDDGFVALKQGFGADAAWERSVLDGREPTGETVVGGVEWRTVDRRDERDTGNHAFSMVAALGGSTVVLHGTASVQEFETVAQSIARDLR